MNNQDFEIIRIKELIKTLLKKQRKTQKELAEYLEVSLPTVKRILGAEEIGLARLQLIANFLDLSLFELIEKAGKESFTYHTFSFEQEKLLSKSMEHILIFRSLVEKKNFKEIEQTLGLPKKQISKICREFEKMNLLELHENDRVRLSVKWPFKWIKNGPLEKTYRDKVSKKILEKSLKAFKNKSIQDFDRDFHYLYEIKLTQSSRKNLVQDMLKLIENYKNISKDESLYSDGKDLEDATGLITCGNFNAWN